VTAAKERAAVMRQIAKISRAWKRAEDFPGEHSIAIKALDMVRRALVAGHHLPAPCKPRKGARTRSAK
jgi:hypothetical protein